MPTIWVRFFVFLIILAQTPSLRFRGACHALNTPSNKPFTISAKGKPFWTNASASKLTKYVTEYPALPKTPPSLPASETFKFFSGDEVIEGVGSLKGVLV